MFDAPSILKARIWHQRTMPRLNEFCYGCHYLLLPLSQLKRTAAVWPLKIDQKSWLAFHRRDHGPRDASELYPWVMELLTRYQLAQHIHEVLLLTIPRVMNYAFNPVSFWFCVDQGGRLRAALAEVNNTFSEHHFYLCAKSDAQVIEPHDVISATKKLHVSPFFQQDGGYKFTLRLRPDRLHVGITYVDNEGKDRLKTRIHGTLEPMTTTALIRRFIAQPWLGYKVIVLIHWQAMKLWVKGTRWYRKPEKSSSDLSTGRWE